MNKGKFQEIAESVGPAILFLVGGFVVGVVAHMAGAPTWAALTCVGCGLAGMAYSVIKDK